MTSDNPPQDRFPIGALVSLHGLTMATHLNGRRGVVASELSREGRLGVQLFPKSDNKKISIKPANLTKQKELLLSSSTNERVEFCWNCQKVVTASKLKVCAKCKLVTYCNQECQQDHWKKEHKQQCKVLRRTRKGKEAGIQDISTASYDAVCDRTQALFGYASRMQDQGNWAGSEKVLRDGIAELKPLEFATLHNSLAVAICEQGGRIDEAIEQMKCAVRISNEKNEIKLSTHLNMAAMLEKQGDFEQAIEYYWKARELDAEKRYSLVQIGNNHMKMNNYEAAEEAFLLFLKEAEPLDNLQDVLEHAAAVSAYINLAKIRFETLMDKFEEAALSGICIPAGSIEEEVQEIRALYQKALEMDPTHENAQRGLAFLNRCIARAEKTGLIC